VNEIVIRAATPDDYEAVLRVWVQGWRSTGLWEPNIEDMRRRIYAEAGTRWRLDIAAHKEQIVGMLALVIAEKRLDQIFIAPAWQGKGIGLQLLARARALLPDGIWLRTAADNVRAWQWYEREGFILEKEEPHPESGFPMKYYRWPSNR